MVSVYDDDKRKIINLGNIFSYSEYESFSNNKKFYAENKDYRIKIDIKE